MLKKKISKLYKMVDGLRICSKCNIEKSVNEYNVRNKKTGTRRRECKACLSAYNKQLRLDNIDQYKEKDKIYHEKNKEYRNQQCSDYRKNNYEKVVQAEKKYYYSNRTQILERKKVYHVINKDNPQYKIKKNLRTRMWSVFNKNVKTGSTIDDMGCGVDFLMEWFEFIFHNYKLNGVDINWENQGGDWEIDHVIPLSKFDMDNRNQFLISAHWTNLFPLPSTLNRSKYNKICTHSIKKQKYLLTYFLKMKDENISLKFLEFFELNGNSTPADLKQLIDDFNQIKL